MAVVAVAVTTALASQGGLGGWLTAPGPTAPSSSATATHDLSRFNDPGEFPNDAEQALLDHLPSQLITDCERPDVDSVPEFYRPDGAARGVERATLQVRGGVSCLTGTTRVTYWQATGGEQWGWVEDLFFTLVNKRRMEEGSCAARHRAWEEWTAGAHSGHMMCFTRDGEAVLEWSYADAMVYAVASRRDGDMDALLAWWSDIGRLLSR